MSRESLSAAICILFGPREISIEATGNIPLLAVCLGQYSGQNNYDTTTQQYSAVLWLEQL